MTKQTGTKKRNVRRILIVITVLAVVVTAAAVGGSFGYAAYQKGRYVNVQDGYILNRLDAQQTYVVRMPAETQAVAGGEAAKKVSSEPVTLTYDHSEKGREHNWDIYTDEEDNQYFYHEETGQLVCIMYNHETPAPAKTTSAAYPSEEEVCAFVEQYLKTLVPQFDLYDLASCKNMCNYAGDPNGRYELYYGVKVGEYYGAQQIHVTCESDGKISGLVFPQDAKYEQMSEEEKAELAARMPDRQQLEQYAQEKMEEEHGDKLVSAKITGVSLCSEGDTYYLDIAMGLQVNIAEDLPVSMYGKAKYPL